MLGDASSDSHQEETSTGSHRRSSLVYLAPLHRAGAFSAGFSQLFALPAVQDPALTSPQSAIQPCRRSQDLQVPCSPFLSHQSWCVWAGCQGSMAQSKPLCAPGNSSHVPASPTQQTLEHASRAGGMETAGSLLKTQAEHKLSLSDPKSLRRGPSGLFLLFHKQVLKSWRSDLSFHLHIFLSDLLNIKHRYLWYPLSPFGFHLLPTWKFY